jgi:hypothetical protein
VLAVLLLLVVAGAVGWYAFPEIRPGQTAEAPPAPPAPPPPAPVPPPAASPAPASVPPPDAASVAPAAGWPEAADGLTPAEVVQRAPSSEAILSVARRRQQTGRHDDALLLFEEAAERGSGPASAALGRMYDPNGFEPGKPFRNPDGRTAARYYKEAASRGDTSVAAPREALRQRLEKEAREGTSSAATALKDYWP